MPSAGQISLAELAGKVAEHYPGAEQLQRTASGTVIVYYSQGNVVGADKIDPLTGKSISVYEISPFMNGVKNLHRSLMLDSGGRIAAGLIAACMLLLTVSGLVLLIHRAGGWRAVVRPLRGSPAQRLHSELGRLMAIALLLSSLTALYLSADRFNLLPAHVHEVEEPAFPSKVDGGPPAAIGNLTALASVDLNDFRELVYPFKNDRNDFYSLRTDQGMGFVDQATGELLAYKPYARHQKVYEFIYMLHTGEGLWWLALLLGLASASVPVMAVTGTQIWWSRRRSLPRLTNNAKPDNSDTVIFVGSESNSTWGFAKCLHDALTDGGHHVHTSSMNDFGYAYPKAERLFILTATYGDGDAPSSASHFLSRLAQAPDSLRLPFCVLGFGDRQFQNFCQYALDVETALKKKAWPQLCTTELIDRQSAQEFSRWGSSLSCALGQPLVLNHAPPRPRTFQMELAERVDYGEQVQAPTTIFRFRMPYGSKTRGWLRRIFRSQPPYFEAGDLVGIFPPDSEIPRLYSLASESRDGTLEICVRKHPHGVCSNYLHNLQPGGCVEAFIRPNPNFRPTYGKSPVILIGAGTGIGPLVGFIRHNRRHRPMYLYWGGRDPNSDFLYEAELTHYLDDRRLTGLNTAFSRIQDKAYVQDKVRADGSTLQQLIRNGGSIMVCGGRNMSASVAQAMEEVLSQQGLSVVTLKSQGRYREDVY